MKIVKFILLSFSICLSQPTYLGLSNWTQSSVIGLSGGGYILKGHNDFRNAASLMRAKRHVRFDVIKYPAGINSQSAAGALKIRGRNLGFKVSRIAYGIFEGRSIENLKTNDYSASDLIISGGYAVRSNSEKLDIGLSLGTFLSRIGSSKSRAFIVSPSIIFNGKWVSLGVSAHNYGKILKEYEKTKEQLNGVVVTSISTSVKSMPLNIELDYLFAHEAKNTLIFSWIYSFSSDFNIRGGISSNKLDLMTDVSFIRNVFSDFGLGIGYNQEDIDIDMNIYSYGPSGFVFSMGISILF